MCVPLRLTPTRVPSRLTSGTHLPIKSPHDTSVQRKPKMTSSEVMLFSTRDSDDRNGGARRIPLTPDKGKAGPSISLLQKAKDSYPGT